MIILPSRYSYANGKHDENHMSFVRSNSVLSNDSSNLRNCKHTKVYISSFNDNVKVQKPLVENIIHYRNVFNGPDMITKRKVEYSKMKVFDDAFREESKRIESLKHYFTGEKSALIKPLAKAGFYKNPNEIGIEDKVKCIYCQGSIDTWDLNCNPMKQHMKYFPTCPFLLRLNVADKPLRVVDIGKGCDYDTPQTTEQNQTSVAVECCVFEPEHLTENPDLILVDQHDLFYRESTFDQSYSTLKEWSMDGLLIMKVDGKNNVLCCGCRKQIPCLKGFESMPKRVFHHANCDYLVKDVVQKENLQKNAGNFAIVEYSIIPEEIEARMDSKIMTISSQKEKISKSTLKKIVENKLKSTGKDYESTYQMLLDINNINLSQDLQKDPFNALEYLLPEPACVVCLDQPIECAFLPCGHLRTCRQCAEKMSSCPVCRAVIDRKVRGIRFHGIN